MLDLIACGQTSWDAEGRLHGATDLPLSEAGLTTVLATAARLPRGRMATVYHSPHEAAADTARLIADACRAKTKVVEHLTDPDLGLLEGLTEAEFAERFPKRWKQWHEDPLSMQPPEGEPLAEARGRLLHEVARLLRRSRAEEIAIVLHRIGHRLLHSWMAGQKLTETLEGRNGPPPPIERLIVPTGLLACLENAQVPEPTASY